MRKWVVAGGAILALLWAPFVYKELSREALVTAEDGAQDDHEALDEDFIDDEPVAVAAIPTEPEAPAEPASELEQEPEAPGAPATTPEPADPVAPAAEEPNFEQLAEAPQADEAVADDDQADEADQTEGDPADAPRPPPEIPESGPYGLVEGVFDSETRDSLWAAERERTLTQELLDQGFAEETVQEVACRRTVCRFQLDLAAEDLAPLMRLAAGLRTSNGDQGLAVSKSELIDDKSRVMVYMPRRGYTMEDLARGR